MMLLGSAFLPALNVPSAARAPARAPAATMGVKAPQSMEGAFVKSRNTLGIQAIRPDAVVPKELRAAIASTFPAKGETTAPPAITEAEVLECQAKWAAAIASISKTYAEDGDFVGAAGEAAGERYGRLGRSLAPAIPSTSPLPKPTPNPNPNANPHPTQASCTAMATTTCAASRKG